MDCLQFGMLVI